MTYVRLFKILLSPVVALVLAYSILIVFVLTFDWNRARPYINRQLSESIGWEFVIRGDLKVRFTQGLKTEPGWRHYLPRPEISADDIQIGNPAWDTTDPPMASAHHIVIALHILPL